MIDIFFVPPITFFFHSFLDHIIMINIYTVSVYKLRPVYCEFFRTVTWQTTEKVLFGPKYLRPQLASFCMYCLVRCNEAKSWALERF